MTSRISPMIYFLIEESARELRSRVLMATIATERGQTCCIVPQWIAWKLFDRLPRGIVVFKGNNSFQTQHMHVAKKAGHRIAAVEEEILGVSSNREIERLFDDETARACDLILAQGDHARTVIEKKDPALTDRIVVTGNPRIDLLRPPFSREIKEKGRKIREMHGPYILVNTNFGSINPKIEDTCFYLDMCQQVGVIDPDRPEDWADFLGWCYWERENLELLTEVIGFLSRRANSPRVIIRPHPSENIEKWTAAFLDEPGVSVIFDGDHLPWTAGAEVLIHTGCTTGVEATMLGVPALSLQGGNSEWHLVHTSNFVNPSASSVERVASLLDLYFSGERDVLLPTEEKRRELVRHVLPWDQDLAAEKVIEALEQLAIRLPSIENPDWYSQDAKQLAFQSSDSKIDPGSFSEDAVSSVAAEFATQLGYRMLPSVKATGSGMIKISPAT